MKQDMTGIEQTGSAFYVWGLESFAKCSHCHSRNVSKGALQFAYRE